MPIKSTELSKKELSFCYEYVANKFNGLRAYLYAFNVTDEPTAGVMACRLLKKANIKDKVEELTQRYLNKLTVTGEDVIAELVLLGFSDIKNYVDFAGDVVTLKSSDIINKHSRAIRKVEIVPTFVKIVDEDGKHQTVEKSKVKLELHDKVKSLDILKQILQLDKDNGTNDKDLSITVSYDD